MYLYVLACMLHSNHERFPPLNLNKTLSDSNKYDINNIFLNRSHMFFFHSDLFYFIFLTCFFCVF